MTNLMNLFQFFNLKKTTVMALVALSLFNLSCDSDDPPMDENPDGVETPITSSVNFENALIRTFLLSEIEANHPEKTTVKQPTMLDGVPQNMGKITIKLAPTSVSKFSLKQVDFDTSEFSISPQVGEQNIIAGKPIIYTITPAKDPSVTLQYEVNVIVKPIDPADEKLAMKTFGFLISDNGESGINSDVFSAEIRDIGGFYQRYDTAVVMSVPDGTNFSNLVPYIEFEGSSIAYTTNVDGDDSDYKEFTAGTSIDFKYPNIVAFKIYNSDKSRFHKVVVYVDIENPIVFDSPSVTLNDGKIVTTGGIDNYDNVIEFTNKGNYPIKTSRLNASEAEVIETPEAQPRLYYSPISLRKDKDELHTGEKGRLALTANFPFTLTGEPGAGSGIVAKSYVVKVQFKTMLSSDAIKAFSTSNNSSNINFEIYNPAEIEIKANVYVEYN